MPELPTNILTSLVGVPQATRLVQAYLQPLDLAPNEQNPFAPDGAAPGSVAAAGKIAFQYWPETLNDSRQSEWNPKNIPGGSHPIYQWTHGGERRISFTAVFTTDTDPGENAVDIDPYERGLSQQANGLEIGVRDIDLRAVVAWLRWFTYPYYDAVGGGMARVYEPAKCLLVMPNTSLGHNGRDYITCVMTTCDVTYEAWFPSGFPRIIEVNLEFAEVVQESLAVAFHNRRDMRRATVVGSYLTRREGDSDVGLRRR